MSKDIWLGIHVPPEGRDFEEMKRICLAVEEAGFDLFTITDHFMNMRNPNGPGNHPLEAWTTLAGLAAVTDRINLGPLVSCYGYRRPTVLAKIATTVNIISGGRLIFGIGAGWHEEEFKGFMGWFPPTRERLVGLRETVEICRAMFTNERTTYRGTLYEVESVLNAPQPVNKPVPILVGGGGEKVTLKIAAEHADISHFFSRSMENLEHKLSVLKMHCKTVGRDYDEIRKATAMGMIIGTTKAEVEAKIRQRARKMEMPLEEVRSRLGLGVGTSETFVDSIKAYTKRGIGLVTFPFPGFEDLHLFSKEVLPRL